MLNAEAASTWGTAEFIVKPVEDESQVKRKSAPCETNLDDKPPAHAETSRQNAGVKRVKMAAAH